MSQGVCLFDANQRVIVANQRYADLYGLPTASIAPGTTLRQILKWRVESGLHGDIDVEKFISEGIASFHREVSNVIDLTDGRSIAVLRKPLANGGLISTHEDITERRRVEVRIAHMAHHDTLTDLPNRMALRERLAKVLAAGAQGEGLAWISTASDWKTAGALSDSFDSIFTSLHLPIWGSFIRIVHLSLRPIHECLAGQLALQSCSKCPKMWIS
jgi:hypothetical protein